MISMVLCYLKIWILNTKNVDVLIPSFLHGDESAHRYGNPSACTSTLGFSLPAHAASSIDEEFAWHALHTAWGSSLYHKPWPCKVPPLGSWCVPGLPPDIEIPAILWPPLLQYSTNINDTRYLHLKKIIICHKNRHYFLGAKSGHNKL